MLLCPVIVNRKRFPFASVNTKERLSSKREMKSVFFVDCDVRKADRLWFAVELQQVADCRRF